MVNTHHNPPLTPRAEHRQAPDANVSPVTLSRPVARRAAGFTMIEMIVAVALTLFVFGLANYVFTDAVQAVRRGADTSQILAESRTLSDTVFEDFKEMIVFQDQVNRLGEPGAFFVLVQQINGPILFPADPTQFRQEPEAWVAGTTAVQRDIRTDQIAFFRDASRIQAVTPGRLGQYSSQAKGSYARIWYGHVATQNSLDVGFNGTVTMNRVTELNLGRQALLLIGENDFLPDGNLSSAGPIDDETVIAAFDPTTRLALGTDQDPGTLTRIDLSEDYATITQPYGEALHEGAMDVLWVNFANMMDEAYLGSGGVLTEAQGAVDATTKLPLATYDRHALSWAYLGDLQRLTAAPNVPSPFDEQDVGRTHGLLLPFVSDFTVDFAADITDDLDLAADPTGSIPGQDTYPDQTPDTDGLGRIKWYNAVSPNPDTDGDGIGNNDATLPVTWPLPLNDAGFTNNNQDGPYHTFAAGSGTMDYPPLAGTFDGVTSTEVDIARPQGGSYGPNIVSRAAFVFGHTSDQDVDNAGADTPTTGTGLEAGSAKWWPYMIRIRYRLHDADATFNAADPVTGQVESGRWFEQIIPIPRPI